MGFSAVGMANIDQDELREKLFKLLVSGSIDNKRLNIKSIAAASGVCHMTIMNFLDGKKIRLLTICRLAEFVRKHEGE